MLVLQKLVFSLAGVSGLRELSNERQRFNLYPKFDNMGLDGGTKQDKSPFSRNSAKTFDFITFLQE